MSPNLTNKLYESFPNLFFTNTADGVSICSVDVGDGWYRILTSLCHVMYKMDEDIQFVQIKEKFGNLRIYTNRSSNADYLIDMSALLSSTTCEDCGNVGTKKIPDDLPTSSWIQTLCEPCRRIGRGNSNHE